MTWRHQSHLGLITKVALRRQPITAAEAHQRPKTGIAVFIENSCLLMIIIPRRNIPSGTLIVTLAPARTLSSSGLEIKTLSMTKCLRAYIALIGSEI